MELEPLAGGITVKDLHKPVVFKTFLVCLVHCFKSADLSEVQDAS